MVVAGGVSYWAETPYQPSESSGEGLTAPFTLRLGLAGTGTGAPGSTINPHSVRRLCFSEGRSFRPLVDPRPPFTSLSPSPQTIVLLNLYRNPQNTAQTADGSHCHVSDVEVQEHYDSFFEVRRAGPGRCWGAASPTLCA
ncbi:uncharacterized protein [Petaurus breviceps papuanus]|uniref:uncharacterized protein isoform X1 n=1 Tax=Petaurus breviceps papuanus TaxID=3040969 RepID=UPI0036DC29B7